MTPPVRLATGLSRARPVGDGRRRLADPRPYAELVAGAAAQLETQRPATSGAPATLVVLPVVGFGGQAALVAQRTVELVAAAAADAEVEDRVVVALVNRPAARPCDGTADALRKWAARYPAAQLLVCDVALTQRPRIGELRQLAVDAAERAWGALTPSGRVLLVDDDIVALPPGSMARLETTLGEACLAVGPVLFDHPQLPSCLLPGFYTADLFRALLADHLLGRLERAPDGLAPEVIESLVLSCNLGVRRDALGGIGGMRDLNELTALARDVLVSPALTDRIRLRRPLRLHGPQTGEDTWSSDPVERLRSGAVRVHSRRALVAFASHGLPPVAQWRACRLRSSQVDPVRTWRPPPPPAPLFAQSARERVAALADLGKHLGVVLDHLQPDLSTARGVLATLGLRGRDVELWAPGEDRWRVKIRRPGGLLERLVELQRAELSEDEPVRLQAVPGGWP